MGVLDGQAVNAAVTNPAFINKNINDTMPNLLGFTNPSTPSIADIQSAVNTLYTATGASEVQSGTNYNATPGTITNGQNYQTAFGILAGKFAPATGHFHTGADGDGPILDVVLSIAITGGTAQTGNITLIPGTNVIMTTPSAGQIQIAVSGGGGSAGVSSIAASGFTALTGSVILKSGIGIDITQSGQDIEISSTSGLIQLSYQNPSVQSLTNGAMTTLTGWTNNIIDTSGGAFDGTTFISPKSGSFLMQFCAGIAPAGIGSAIGFIILNGTIVSSALFTQQPTNGTTTAVPVLVPLSIGDEITFAITSAATADTSLAGDPTFTTFLILQVS